MTTIVTRERAGSRQPAPRSHLILRDHPLEVALFNNVGPITFLWLAVRVWLGVQWVQAGWSKLQDPEWMSGARILSYWQAALKDFGKPNSDVAFGWYAGFLQSLVDSQSQTWFAPLVAWGELLGGVALVLGLFTGLAAFTLAFMNFNYMLAGSAGLNPLYFVLAILLILAWKNAGWWGLDRFILPALSRPEEPGSMFDPSARNPQPHKAEGP